jgi:hypothetical protein
MNSVTTSTLYDAFAKLSIPFQEEGGGIFSVEKLDASAKDIKEIFAKTFPDLILHVSEEPQRYICSFGMHPENQVIGGDGTLSKVLFDPLDSSSPSKFAERDPQYTFRYTSIHNSSNLVDGRKFLSPGEVKQPIGRIEVTFPTEDGIRFECLESIALDQAVFAVHKPETQWAVWGAPHTVWSEQLEASRIGPKDKSTIQNFCDSFEQKKSKIPLFVFVDTFGQITSAAGGEIIEKVARIQDAEDCLLLLFRKQPDLSIILQELYMDFYSFKYFICPRVSQNRLKPLEIVIFEKSQLRTTEFKNLVEKMDAASTLELFRSEMAIAETGVSPLQEAMEAYIAEHPGSYCYRTTPLENTFERINKMLDWRDYVIKNAFYTSESRMIRRSEKQESIGGFLYGSPDLSNMDGRIILTCGDEYVREFVAQSGLSSKVRFTGDYPESANGMPEQPAFAEVYAIVLEKLKLEHISME